MGRTAGKNLGKFNFWHVMGQMLDNGSPTLLGLSRDQILLGIQSLDYTEVKILSVLSSVPIISMASILTTLFESRVSIF